MKKGIILFFTIFLSFIPLLANATTKAAKFPLPGTSIADSVLQKDTYVPILAYTMSIDKGCKDISITDTKLTLPPQDVKVVNRKVVSGYWQELWTVNHCGEQIQYPIVFTLDGKGGAYYNIKLKDAIK